MIVVNGASVPQCKISNKHLVICYHAIQEALAAGIWRVGFLKGKYNIFYCLTKIVSSAEK